MPSLKKPDTSQGLPGTPSHWPTDRWATFLIRQSTEDRYRSTVNIWYNFHSNVFQSVPKIFFKHIQTREFETHLFPIIYTVMVGKSNIQNAGKQVLSFHS